VTNADAREVDNVNIKGVELFEFVCGSLDLKWY